MTASGKRIQGLRRRINSWRQERKDGGVRKRIG